jgi:hypothetical protein
MPRHPDLKSGSGAHRITGDLLALHIASLAATRSLSCVGTGWCLS